MDLLSGLCMPSPALQQPCSGEGGSARGHQPAEVPLSPRWPSGEHQPAGVPLSSAPDHSSGGTSRQECRLAPADDDGDVDDDADDDDADDDDDHLRVACYFGLTPARPTHAQVVQSCAAWV